MNEPLTGNQPLTMTSEQIAELLDLRHDNIRKTATNLASRGAIAFTEYTVKGSYQDWLNVISDVKNNHEFTQCLITPLGQIEITKLWETSKGE